MEFLIISSRGRFLAETRTSAEMLARILSAFDYEAVQVLKHGTPIAAYYQQHECQREDDGFYWELTQDGQHMTREFEFLNA